MVYYCIIRQKTVEKHCACPLNTVSVYLSLPACRQAGGERNDLSADRQANWRLAMTNMRSTTSRRFLDVAFKIKCYYPNTLLLNLIGHYVGERNASSRTSLYCCKRETLKKLLKKFPCRSI